MTFNWEIGSISYLIDFTQNRKLKRTNPSNEIFYFSVQFESYISNDIFRLNEINSMN